jgi:predicted phosphodiesterase
VIEVESRRIGLVHGHGGWSHYLRSKVRDRFGYDEEHYLKIVHGSFGPVDAIVFGHTHRFYQAERSGILLFNPGPIAPDFYNTLAHRSACCMSRRRLFSSKSSPCSHRLETSLALA